MPAAAARLVERVVEAAGVLAAGHRQRRVLAAAALDRLRRVGDQLAGVEAAVRR